MKIIIIGAGLTGTELAKKLISEKNDVVLIDNNEETVRHVSNRLDCMVIHADGNSLDTLEEAGIARADALVMLTNSDEVNMITCSLVEAFYPKVMKIARVRNYEYHIKARKTARRKSAEPEGEARPLYGIDHMVYPDMEAAMAILRAIEHGAVTDVLSFENSEYEIMRVEVEEGSRLDGQRVRPSCWCIWRARRRQPCPWAPPSFRRGTTWESLPTKSTWRVFWSCAATESPS